MLICETRSLQDLKEQQLNIPASLLDFIDDQDTGLTCFVALSDGFGQETGLRALVKFGDANKVFMFL